MKTQIEALLVVEPHQLTEPERAELDAALAADDQAMAMVVALLANRESVDKIEDPFATKSRSIEWRAPAHIAAETKRRRWPALAIAAVILLIAGAAIAVVATLQRDEERATQSEPAEPTVAPDREPQKLNSSARPQPTKARANTERVIATFQADTATIDLVGVEVPSAVERQAAFPMTLYWRVRAPYPEDPPPQERWRVFVHFDIKFDGRGSRFQADHGIESDGAWWLSDDIVEDRFPVMAGRVKDPYPAGTYDIFVGWFKGGPGAWTNATFTRADGTSDPRDDNRLHVGRIELR